MSEDKKEQQKEQLEIPVNVLIIAHKQSQFAAAASFLTRRGFPCTVKGNIRDGLQFITKQKATHVFLSWNLPGANIVKTYQLIAKTFKVDCVVYAEKADGKTAAELTMSRLPEVMQAPVSGPGLYMRIQKLIKQKEEGPTLTPAERKAALQQQRAASITLKSAKEVPTDGTWENAGVDPEDGQPIYRFKSNNPNHKHKGTFTFKGPKPPELDKDGNWGGGSGVFKHESDEKDESTGNLVNFQKSGPKYSEEDFQSANGDDSLNDISDLLSEADLGELASQTETGIGQAEDLSANENGLNTEELDATLDSAEAEDHEASSDGADTTKSGSWKSKRSKEPKDYGSVLNVAKKVDKKESALPEYEQTAAKESLVINIEPKMKSNGPTSLLAEKVLEAIKNSTKPSGKIDKKIEELNEAKALTIHSSRFNGYLLLASANGILKNDETFQNIKDHLIILLDKVGEKLLNLEELDLDLQGLQIDIWAQEHAEFIISSSHEGQEIMCAFISTVGTLPKVKENPDPKMVTIGSDDLAANTKSKFNLYLHLPKNNKYIRYLRPGDTINSQHVEKFEKHQLNDLHIKKDELKSFKEYFASNKLATLSTSTKKKAS